jgi:hypothetical protein
MGERTKREESRSNKAQREWQQMIWDHLPGAEPQLKRFGRWKEDYA